MKKNASFKCIIPLCMSYMSLMICSDLLVYKLVSMHFGFTTAATLTFPLWFIFNDIIAEVYGPKLCWQIIWTGYIVQTFLNLLIYFVIHLPSPSGWGHQDSYNLVLGSLLRIELSTLIIFLISANINICLLTKWKVLMLGKYFWLRSIGSSAIGEAIYSVLNIWPIMLGSMELSKLPMIMLWSFSLKILYTIIFAYPATILVGLLKKIDGVDVYDPEWSFNPFKSRLNDRVERSEGNILATN